MYLTMGTHLNSSEITILNPEKSGLLHGRIKLYNFVLEECYANLLRSHSKSFSHSRHHLLQLLCYHYGQWMTVNSDVIHWHNIPRYFLLFAWLIEIVDWDHLLRLC